MRISMICGWLTSRPTGISGRLRKAPSIMPKRPLAGNVDQAPRRKTRAGNAAQLSQSFWVRQIRIRFDKRAGAGWYNPPAASIFSRHSTAVEISGVYSRNAWDWIKSPSTISRSSHAAVGWVAMMQRATRRPLVSRQAWASSSVLPCHSHPAARVPEAASGIRRFSSRWRCDRRSGSGRALSAAR